MAKIVKVILTYERRGIGTPDDPVRMCPQLFSLYGQIIAESDPMPKGNIENPTAYFNAAPLYGLSE